MNCLLFQPGGGEPILQADLPTVPGITYSFYVTASNRVGTSLPSERSEDVSTPEALPARNPRRVCTRLGNAGQFVVTWEVHVG